jgi:MSHA biogenesis protein MshK
MRLIFLAWLAFVSSAYAQSNDPTRPPAAWINAPEPGAAGADAATGSRLQSVLYRPGGRSVAIIGGKTVALGEQVGGARLVRVNEREAVLQGADGVTHLYLTPDVEKQMIVTPKSRKAGKAGPVKDLP